VVFREVLRISSLGARPGCDPLTRFWSPCPQLKGWLLSRGTMRATEGEAAQGAGRGIGKGKGRGWRGPWGVHACCSKNKPPPLTGPPGP